MKSVEAGTETENMKLERNTKMAKSKAVALRATGEVSNPLSRKQMAENLLTYGKIAGMKPLPKSTVKQWLAICKKAGRQIDPETAEVDWNYALTLDPYGVHPELPEEYWQVGREYFARSPGSDVWVWFGDLPKATSNALWKRHSKKLAFPAGLEGIV
jgi:hypothetical protein